jgi:TRAP-type mannitol/chloroaromatic compound transport system substrate-binding protein
MNTVNKSVMKKGTTMSIFANGRYYPLVILILVAALMTVTGLWAVDRASTQGDVLVEGNNSQQLQTYHWKMVTTWPKNLPGLGRAPETFSKLLDEMSNGRLKVHVYGAGELVPAMGVFDAVSEGVVEMGHGAAYYWKGKVPAAVFFTGVPFGLNAQEMNGWLHYGGGMELWKEVYEPFNLVPLAGGNTGVQMAGWFNTELTSVEDLQGLKMRIPGIGGEVFNEAGGTAVTIPGGELYTSLQTGVIDATEWVAPYNDLALGLHEVAKYYYYPGWHEPGSTLEIIINSQAFESLPQDLRVMVKAAAYTANQDMLDEYTARNNAALQEMINNHGVQLRKLPDDVLRKLKESSAIVLEDYAAADPLAGKVYESFTAFRKSVIEYHHISEQAYINARDL